MRPLTPKAWAVIGAVAALAALLVIGLYVVFPPGGLPPADPSRDGPLLEGPPPDAPTDVEQPSEADAGLPDASISPEPPELPPLTNLDTQPKTREEQHEALFATLRLHYQLDAQAMAAVQKIFSAKRIGQGYPAATTHPMTKRECLDIRKKAELEPTYHPRCGAPDDRRRSNMVPIYNPKAGETEATAGACIDQFEFPNIACEYPVTWVSAREAVKLCEAVGKRLCDAHEWEGACAGAVLPVETEYHWKLDRKNAKGKHNNEREKVWAYGPEKDHRICGTGSKKNDDCGNGGKCGSNTYPAGAFPRCKSPLGVFDLHGNAAEHMNLPMGPDELASKGKYGQTEMKGSWFIFHSYEAHEDDCRWRAPDWHATDVMSVDSHANYHLGFRCCADAGG